MRNLSTFVIRIALLFLATPGLAPAAGQASNIPSPNSVASISVSQRKDASFVRITDRAKIEKTLAVLLANNRGWERSLITFPTPQGSAMFNREKVMPPLMQEIQRAVQDLQAQNKK